MRSIEFYKLRSGLKLNAPAAPPRARHAMANALQGALVGSGLFHTVEVTWTQDEDRLVAALLHFAPGTDETEVGATLQRVWEEASHSFWRAHTTLTQRGHVELQGATRDGQTGQYLTLHLLAQAATVPVQRHERRAPALPGQHRRTRRIGRFLLGGA